MKQSCPSLATERAPWAGKSKVEIKISKFHPCKCCTFVEASPVTQKMLIISRSWGVKEDLMLNSWIESYSVLSFKRSSILIQIIHLRRFQLKREDKHAFPFCGEWMSDFQGSIFIFGRGTTFLTHETFIIPWAFHWVELIGVFWWIFHISRFFTPTPPGNRIDTKHDVSWSLVSPASKSWHHFGVCWISGVFFWGEIAILCVEVSRLKRWQTKTYKTRHMKSMLENPPLLEKFY